MADGVDVVDAMEDDIAKLHAAVDQQLRVSTFHKSYKLQLVANGCIIVTLGVGLCDTAFRPVCAVLLPVAVLQRVGRQYLARMADKGRAQEIGATAALLTTTGGWGLYVFLTRILARDARDAGFFVFFVISISMIVFPLLLHLFMLTRRQSLVAAAVALAAVAAAPPWSELAWNEQFMAHALALSFGAVIADAITTQQRAAYIRSLSLKRENDRLQAASAKSR